MSRIPTRAGPRAPESGPPRPGARPPEAWGSAPRGLGLRPPDPGTPFGRTVRLVTATATPTTPLAAALDVRWLGRMAYTPAWDLQREMHAARVAGEVPDTVLLVEHDPVYTAGKRTEPHERPVDGTPVVEVDRGGKITWHGPGQLVGYPILALPDPVDVVAYVRRMERALMTVCGEFGLATMQVEGRSGVWIAADDGWNGARPPRPERKIAAIGIRVARGVTLHGFALNANPDLGAYGGIVPCGLEGVGVTSLSAELGRDVTLDEVRPIVEAHLGSLRTIS